MPAGAPSDSDPSQYFQEEPTVASQLRSVDLVLPDLTVSLLSDRGVFSADQVDPGTRYLLLEAPAPPSEAALVADVGCGYGAIARTLAHRAPAAQVWAVDVNRRARELAAANLQGFDAVIAHPDEVPADLRFDLIWSNPPIRIGKRALHDLLRTWLDRLADGGEAVLVVHRHLGSDSLVTWLQDQGWPTTRLGSRQGYRLLRVVRAR